MLQMKNTTDYDCGAVALYNHAITNKLIPANTIYQKYLNKLIQKKIIHKDEGLKYSRLPALVKEIPTHKINNKKKHLFLEYCPNLSIPDLYHIVYIHKIDGNMLHVTNFFIDQGIKTTYFSQYNVKYLTKSLQARFVTITKGNYNEYFNR